MAEETTSFPADKKPELIDKVEVFETETPSLKLPSGTVGAPTLSEGVFPMRTGVALVFSGARKDGTLIFHGMTNRGPTLPAPRVRGEDGSLSQARYFLSPMFQPRIMRIEVGAGRARVLGPVALTNSEGKAYSGLPPRDRKFGKVLSLANKEISGSNRSVDPEGLAISADGGFWVTDAYGPAIRLFSAQGVERDALTPGDGLPAGLAGFPDALCGLSVLPDGRLITIDMDSLGIDRFARLIVIDPVARTSRSYLWALERQTWKRTARPVIGDLAAAGPEQFLVLESGIAKGGARRAQLVLADFSEAEEITGIPSDKIARWKRNRPGIVARTTLMNLADLGQNAASIKGIALLPDGQTVAAVSDSNFGAELRVEDPVIEVPTVTDYVLEADGTLTFAGEKSGARLTVVRKNPTDIRTQFFLIRLGRPVLGGDEEETEGAGEPAETPQPAD
ncbi:esterase-like activity of phytase family protein [Sutterella sp.]|uniref:esterase-like activity of phytase family protein n=1 Tax=Sutterella sp. TaxID=1981025 RepID=UPI0026E0F749|nr:esterase-like activity of phytase family protein [Sutterella sp.]MDO5531496.1 esterase-like activity of phytase family protein [Sutterella sp.]